MEGLAANFQVLEQIFFLNGLLGVFYGFRLRRYSFRWVIMEATGGGTSS